MSSAPISNAPAARMAAALAASLALHAVAAHGLDALLAPSGNSPGADGAALTIRARLGAALAQAQAPAPSSPAPRSAAARDERSIPAVPAPRYVNVAELDVRPQIMTHVMPEYPADVLSGTRGRVVLELFIGSDGRVDAVKIAAAQPPGKFDGAATAAFARARFTPGMQKGKPVASLLLVEVTFGD